MVRGSREESSSDEGRRQRVKTNDTGRALPGDPLAARATEARSHLVYRYEDEERVIEVVRPIPGRAGQDVPRETTNRQCYAVWTSSPLLDMTLCALPCPSFPCRFLLLRRLSLDPAGPGAAVSLRPRCFARTRLAGSGTLSEKDDSPLHVQIANHGSLAPGPVAYR